MDGWNTTFILGWPVFRGELLVPGRVIWITPQQKPNKKQKVSWNMSWTFDFCVRCNMSDLKFVPHYVSTTWLLVIYGKLLG